MCVCQTKANTDLRRYYEKVTAITTEIEFATEPTRDVFILSFHGLLPQIKCPLVIQALASN